MPNVNGLCDLQYISKLQTQARPQLWEKRKSRGSGGKADTLRKRRCTVKPSENSDAHLLKIPAELRNDIYRLALLEEEPIMITRDVHEGPALLRACKTTSGEATGIYAEENEFVIEIVDCEPHIPKITSEFWLWKRRIPVLMELSGQPDWDNLTAWLKDCYHGQLLGLASQEGNDDNAAVPEKWKIMHVAFEALAMTMHYKHSWREFEEQLQWLKRAVQAGIHDGGQSWGAED